MVEKKAIAIIIARGGSKRIPRKNIKDFFGHPIIKYSIDAAIQADCFNEIMVSTDDLEIAEIARQYGAKVPFLRSKATSDDYATTAEVIYEVLNEYRSQGVTFTYCCCIYPTAPFVTKEKLLGAFDLLIKHKADSIIPITKFSFPIWRSFKVENDKLKYIYPDKAQSRSQDLPESFHDCGQFYFLKVNQFLQSRLMVSDKTYGLEVPGSEVQDIDDEEDWKIAEAKYELFVKMKNNF